MDDKLANMRVALEDLTLVARDHDVRIDGTLARIGVVRFDAYQDLGGRQSAAVAFLNSQGNGVVITTVVSRDFARMYVKLLKDGAPDIPLAPEEIEAVEQARGRRAVHHQARGWSAMDIGHVSDSRDRCRLRRHARPPACPDAAARPSGNWPARTGAASAQGLPPVVETVTPSATGWEDPRPRRPTPTAWRRSTCGSARPRAPGGTPNDSRTPTATGTATAMTCDAEAASSSARGPSRSLSEPLPVAATTIGFLGPQGTFTEVALRATIDEQAPDGRARRFMPFASMQDTIEAVSSGEVDCSIVPIENSIEGSVSATVDILAHEIDNLQIVREVRIPVRHQLLARPGVTLEQITKVVSHPHANAQCRIWLRAQPAGRAR